MGAMRAAIASYALYGIDAIPVEVRVEGDRARVIDPSGGRCLLDQTGGTILSGCNLAPAYLRKKRRVTA